MRQNVERQHKRASLQLWLAFITEHLKDCVGIGHPPATTVTFDELVTLMPSTVPPMLRYVSETDASDIKAAVEGNESGFTVTISRYLKYADSPGSGRCLDITWKWQ